MSLKLVYLIGIAVPVFYFDIKYKKIPNWLTLGGWFCFALILILIEKQIPVQYFLTSVIALLSYLAVFFLSHRKLGMGDIKLALLLGGINGVIGWYFTNLIAAMTALIVFGILFLNKKVSPASKIPFGPFLCTGSIVNQVLIGYGIL